MKLARNLMHFVSFTAATEAQRLAEAAGLDMVELGEVVRHTDAITGGPGAIMLRATTARSPTTTGTRLRPRARPRGEGPSLATGSAKARCRVPLAELASRETGSRTRRAATGEWIMKGQVRRTARGTTPGLEKMEKVYGFEMSDGGGHFCRTRPTTCSRTSGTGRDSPTATAGCC